MKDTPKILSGSQWVGPNISGGRESTSTGSDVMIICVVFGIVLHLVPVRQNGGLSEGIEDWNLLAG